VRRVHRRVPAGTPRRELPDSRASGDGAGAGDDRGVDHGRARSRMDDIAVVRPGSWRLCSHRSAGLKRIRCSTRPNPCTRCAFIPWSTARRQRGSWDIIRVRSLTPSETPMRGSPRDALTRESRRDHRGSDPSAMVWARVEEGSISCLSVSAERAQGFHRMSSPIAVRPSWAGATDVINIYRASLRHLRCKARRQTPERQAQMLCVRARPGLLRLRRDSRLSMTVVPRHKQGRLGRARASFRKEA